MFIFVAILSTVYSARLPGKTGISKVQAVIAFLIKIYTFNIVILIST